MLVYKNTRLFNPYWQELDRITEKLIHNKALSQKYNILRIPGRDTDRITGKLNQKSS